MSAQRNWTAGAALVLAAGLLYWLFLLRPMALQEGVGAAPRALEPEAWIGQVYPARLVVLQPAEERKSGPWPEQLALLPLHTPGRMALPAALEAGQPRTLPPLYPPGYGGIDAPLLPAACAAAAAAVPPAASGAHYVANKDFEDYFAAGMPDHCEPDQGLLGYEASVPVTASMPVLAVAGLPPLQADTSVAGQPRPLSLAEQAGVRAYREGWQAEFRKAFGKDYDAELSPTGAIPTLADAQQLAVMNDATGRPRLRVSHWGKTSVAMHLTEVFIVDLLDDDGKVLRSWRFARAQGALG
ncbi:hypothetical protein [Pelomonas sp. KK5]|uniref:hypothetical protein n=1 Tax=Pelomonas sp. KK5 TaxID=1855730 RepID=UPI001301F539|nr:hypothetical protein [Pelomonas sp. KK5]